MRTLTKEQKLKALEKSGYKLMARDPEVKPLFAGAWMVIDLLDDDKEDAYSIVGDDPDALVNEAHEFTQWAFRP